jgi:hypothetical protein
MRLTLYLPLLLLCALSIAACTSAEEARELEDREREFSLGGKIADYIDQGFGQVQCPDDVDADQGGRYRCVAKAQDGTSVAINVVQPHPESSPSVSTMLLETRKVEMRLRHDFDVGRPSEGLSPRDLVVRDWYAIFGLYAGRPPEARVGLFDCQDLVEVKKGAHFTCKGTVNVLDFTVRATFTNDRGMFSYTVLPS